MPAFWENIKNQRYYFYALGETMDVNVSEDWKTIDFEVIRLHCNAISRRYGSKKTCLNSLFPEFFWENEFILDSSKITKAQDWYRVSKQDLETLHGKEKWMDSLTNLYPSHDWNIALFSQNKKKCDEIFLSQTVNNLIQM